MYKNRLHTYRMQYLYVYDMNQKEKEIETMKENGNNVTERAINLLKKNEKNNKHKNNSNSIKRIGLPSSFNDTEHTEQKKQSPRNG